MSGARLAHCRIRPCRSVFSCAPGTFVARPPPTSTQGAMLHHPHHSPREIGEQLRRVAPAPDLPETGIRLDYDTFPERVAQPASEDKAVRAGAAAGPARSRRRRGASTPVSLRRWQLRLAWVLSAQ